jgi:APA family basic amino acid/polyamine antiporter
MADTSTGQVGSSGGPAATVPLQSAPFMRKATGLVRELSLLDMITYNAAVQTPISAALAFSLFFAFAAFPGANLIVDLIVSLVLVSFTFVTWALLSAAMPRIGGDYAYISRIIHPALALASNLCYLLGALLATAWIGTIAVRTVMAPAMVIVGRLSGNNWWVTASATIAQNGWTFAISSALVIATGVVAIFGTKLAGRFCTWFYLISLGGALVTLFILLFTSHGAFVRDLNDFSLPFTHTKNTYGATIAAGSKAGLVYPSVSGYSFKNTLGALFVTYGLTVSAYAAVYLSGEMKGAGRRGRQLSSTFISGIGQGLLLLVCVIVFLHTTGYNFFVAANNGAYGVPVSPYANFFAGVVGGSSALGGLLGLAFLLCIPPWIYTNAAIVYRGPFAWSFDGLVPRSFAKVNPRTHTPVVAITVVTVLAVAACAWASFSTSFLTLFSYLVLLGYFTITIVGLAAVLMRRRLPDVYNGSPADWRVGGVRVLPVAGAVTVVVNVFMIGLGLWFHANIGLPHLITPILVLCGVSLAGVLFYYIAKAVQSQHGIDISLAYKSIPPE